MEVPPGRVERIADGGPETIRTTLPEILKDAASARAQLEVRTYDYGHSSISIDHLQRSYPEAAVEGIGDPDEVLDQAIAQEARERETYEKELEARRDQERTLVEREEELYRRKWELEQEYQRSATRQRELDSLRAELQTVKEASGLILSRLEERRTSQDVEVESRKKVLAMEAEKAKSELEGQRRSLSERQAKLGGLEREFASKEATYRDRETSLDARAASLERERKQMNDLYANLQAEAEKISEDRKESFPRSMAGLEAREAELAEKSAKLAKQAEAFEAQDVGLDDQREELERATKRMQKLAKDLAAKDRKVSE